jgi:hypothetical protein
MMLPEDYVARILSISGVFQGSDDGSIMQRRDLLSIGWELFVDHPIFGVGLGGYDWHVREYTQVLGMLDPGIDMSAHNTYVEVATEQGVVGLVAFIALIGYAGLALTRTARDLRQQRRDADADLVINFAVGAMAYLVALLFLTFTDRLFWMLVALALIVPQIAGLSMRGRAGSLAGVASGASARAPRTGAATGIAAAPLVGTGREASGREEVHPPAPAEPAAARHPGGETRKREARRPTVFVTGSRCSGVSEARNLIRARDETMTSILMLAPETTTGAELLALCRGTRLIWVYRNFRAATATSARQLTESHNELRLERLLRQIHADRHRSWQRRQIECIRSRAKG